MSYAIFVNHNGYGFTLYCCDRFYKEVCYFDTRQEAVEAAEKEVKNYYSD